MQALRAVFAMTATTLVGTLGFAQSYPIKPVRIITAEVGGGTDFAARIVAHGLSASLGQQFIVENRSSLVATLTVVKAPADGYTLLVAGSSFAAAPLLEDLPYETLRDLAPITLIARAPNVLVVHPSLPVKSVKQLIAFAKARPGTLNYAAGSIGSSTHVAAELFNSMAGIKMMRINYKGTGPAFNDLVAGEVHLMFPAAAGVSPHIKAGRLRALAVTSAQPTALLPGVPTIAASGLPGYESVGMTGLLAPAGTPTPIIKRLSQEAARALNQDDVKQKFMSVGIDTIGNSPEEYTAAIKANIASVSKVIKDANLRSK